MIKQIMIPVAAFAITATGASAFTGVDWSELDIGLTDTQVTALEEAHEIREAAHTEAQQVLEDAGIDEETMQEVREARREMHQAQREIVRAALEDGDYDAFVEAVADTPLADAIGSEADFALFLEAHELREAGDYEAAREIMSELDLPESRNMMKGGGHGGPQGEGFGGPGRNGDRLSAKAK